MSRDAEVIWQELLELLRHHEQVPASLRGFLGLVTPKGVMGGTIYLEVANDFTRSMIEQRARQPLLEAIAGVGAADGITSFAVIVNPDVEPVAAPDETAYDQVVTHPTVVDEVEQAHSSAEVTEFSTDYPQAQGQGGLARLGEAPTQSSTRLNSKYTFDNFIIGGSNRFAHAAAVAVAEAPARSYNPLFIYGESGLGKTHLLHAIGNYAENIYPGIQVRYVSSEEFTNDFINSIANNKGQEFHARYRSNDILMIDDIQFLQGKDSTMEAFFHTFNTLHEHDKQVVITSDVQPKQLTGFEDRMRSRFEWGLITDVQSPDLETRIAILRKKAQADNISLPDDAIEFIAVHVTSSIRELEGTLIRVTAFANLNDQPIDLQLVTTVLKDLITDDEPAIITPEDIIVETADYFRMSVDDLYGSSRSHAIAMVRQIAMYLCREMTSLSLPKIGQLFGGRDHTTVIYAHRKITKTLTEDRTVYNQITELTGRLRQRRTH
ncbi:chromosomal replication initiator protein DnaA [Gulosibacter macacae]|uniref:Chromosomal replication initiator protein DnaA n=1 Tax=Gulosibacter macacae TaxID=2488791 RepID=A0A3P3VVP1_9MICO|nr:chromosomal replication initiator protein DnaA [Gulosibacter macacae]RRJ86514.1 chromosomal replication initiator protein DnaA [Gulosibacter macacae]